MACIITEPFDDDDLRRFNSEVGPEENWLDYCIRCGAKLKGKGIPAHTEDELYHYVGLHCLKCLPSHIA
jgi:hypothetical protein